MGKVKSKHGKDNIMGKDISIYSAGDFDSIRTLLLAASSAYGEKSAFILKVRGGDGKEEYVHMSYSKFGEDIASMGTALLNRGYGGKRIAVVGINSYEWLVAYFASLNIGAIGIPLDKGLPEEEVVNSLLRSKADVLFFDEEHREMAESIRANGSTAVSEFALLDISNGNIVEQTEGFQLYSTLLEEGRIARSEGDEGYDKITVDPDALGIILFTSGTTSMAKAVMLTQRNISSNIYGIWHTEDVYTTDVNIAFLPFHHTFGSTGMLYMLVSGAVTVFCDGLRYIGKNLEEYGVSVFFSVPLILEAMHKKIFAEVEKQGKTKVLRKLMKVSDFLYGMGIDVRRKLFKSIIDGLGGAMRFVITGAAAIDPAVVKDFASFGILSVQGYGLTETSPVLTAESPGNIRPGSVGKALPNVYIKIDSPDENGIGEVCAKGPNIMLGYYQDEEESADVLRDGWFHTGDYGYLDKDGFLFLRGRKKNVIVQKNGKNIYPEEIEVLLANLPYVSECIVFAEESRNDLIICAKLVYNAEYVKERYAGTEAVKEADGEKFIDEEALTKIIKEEIDSSINPILPLYKNVKRLYLTSEPMVKTTSGKIKRHEAISDIGG